MKILSYILASVWVVMAVATINGFEPRTSSIVISFLISAIGTFEMAQDYK